MTATPHEIAVSTATFVDIMSFLHPMTAEEAASHIRSWLKQPLVRIPESTPDHIERVLGLLADLATAGNLVTDAQIAAVALEHDAVVHPADADFIRFAGLRWLNPLTGAGQPSRRHRRATPKVPS